jgi:hypothetical protein
MSVLDGFPLDADITLSELRHEETLSERLRAFHRLRLRRRNDVVGVILDANEWRTLEEYVRSLEQRLEHYEDQAVRAIISERAPHASFTQATPEVIDDIERQYQTLTASE